jgi:preprotein translocase subunit SecB
MNKESNNMNSILQFKNYKVNKLYFCEDDKLISADDTFKVNPHFMKNINIIDDKNFEVTVGCKIESTSENPFPFDLEVVLTGDFSISEKDANYETLINENAVAILFPYLRSIISSLTLNANRNSLILPTFNFVKVFERLENK